MRRALRLSRPPRPPRAPAAGAGRAAAPLRQPGADWAWRPGPWSGAGPEAGALPSGAGADLGDGVRLFHDAAACDIRVERPQGAGGVRLLALDIAAFDGGFLSLAIALPPAALAGLGRHHLLGLDLDFGSRRGRAVARLNLRQGPNTEALPRAVEGAGRCGAEFDLWQIETEPGQAEAGWIDLIFEAPLPARLEIRDLVVARRPRAAF